MVSNYNGYMMSMMSFIGFFVRFNEYLYSNKGEDRRFFVSIFVNYITD